ncbi:MiaB/RimO family radical SAM methylthiotransferase, partial [Candidatus Woesearchaeota archaeon]|nr:MiaB/RimO family radical SAM methylthiotransferase [Candidatus Woesearchaeota archaeon]
LDGLNKEYPYKIIIIAGCISQIDQEKLVRYPLIGTHNITRVVEVVEEALHENILKLVEGGEDPPLDMPKIRRNPIVEIIPIARGCLSNCAYCKTKSARGILRSYLPKEIISVAEKAVLEGVKEIWLTSEDNFCYGFDIGTNLPNLVKELITIKGDFKIKIGMGSPSHLHTIKQELFPLFNEQNVFRFIHTPIQSGSNKILKEMKQNITREACISMVKELKEIVPEITIAIDLMMGYPTETEEDYWDTLNLLREIIPDNISVFRSLARPKAKAAELKELSEEAQRRSKVLADIFKNISLLQNERWLGWVGEIIIDEFEKERKQWIGRNRSYKPVIIEGEFKLGDVVKVKIEKAGMVGLLGKKVG